MLDLFAGRRDKRDKRDEERKKRERFRENETCEYALETILFCIETSEYALKNLFAIQPLLS